MKLHVFNPEHDTALSMNVSHYTAPRAASKLREDLGYLPALWADEGDWVLVSNVLEAVRAVKQIKFRTADVKFLTPQMLTGIDVEGLEVQAWGWDSMLKYQLMAINKGLERILPSDERLQVIRTLSNRRWAGEHILRQLTRLDDNIIGASVYAESIDQVAQTVKSGGKYVIKAPWSGSGRGLRYVDVPVVKRWSGVNIYQQKWTKNIIAQQGGVMIEPYYNKVLDFGMEFTSHNNTVDYDGLSLFYTHNGKYAGNVIAPESDKEQVLAQYIDIDLVGRMRDKIVEILSASLASAYEGAFGIDMMIVETGDCVRLHPCVELNLRRTMGHVALSLAEVEGMNNCIFSIEYNDKYSVNISQNTGEFVPKSVW